MRWLELLFEWYVARRAWRRRRPRRTMRWPELLFEWYVARRAWRRRRPRRRQMVPLLIFLLACIICNAGMMACGMVVYTMQEIGLLPTLTPTPEATPYPSGGSRTLPGMLLSPLLL